MIRVSLQVVRDASAGLARQLGAPRVYLVPVLFLIAAAPYAYADEERHRAVDLSVLYTADLRHNAMGGLKLGSRYLDNLDVIVAVDAERAFGWRGASLFFHGLYNNGARLSADLVGDDQGISNVETGVAAWRVYEAWIDQDLGRASLKFGLYDLNSEFDAIETAGLFLLSSHGIGPDFSQGGRNGPSIFPTTSLALRGDYEVSEDLIVRAAILDGVPGDPEHPARTTIDLSADDGALIVSELDYRSDRLRIAAGYWRYSSTFEDIPATQAAGHSIESRGSDGAYIFVEWRLSQEAREETEGLSGWLRIGVADDTFNPIDAYVGTGFVYTGALPGREQDQFGLALAWANYGAPYRQSMALAGEKIEAREIVIEASYRSALTERMTLQPNVQYVINPGGDATLNDALVLGLRVEVGL